MTQRTRKHFAISTALSYLSDSEIAKRLRQASYTDGWGQNTQINFAGHKVFVKRIPLTALESENRYSTKNHFRLPTYYNYGVGSAGFGAFRELATHIKTSNWVLQGEIQNFPIMHHHRILPAAGSHKSFFDDETSLAAYVSAWNNSKSVERYIRARTAAPFELVLFLEHIEFQMVPWLAEHPRKLAPMVRQLLETVDFLHEKRVIHFDAHGENLMTDGKIPILGDFGLTLDLDFDLSAREKSFFSEHRLYDYGQILTIIGQPILFAYLALNETEREQLHQTIGTPLEPIHEFARAINNAIINGDKPFGEKLRAQDETLIRQYGSVVNLVNQFFADLRRAKRKNTHFPNTKLKRALKRAGVL